MTRQIPTSKQYTDARGLIAKYVAQYTEFREAFRKNRAFKIQAEGTALKFRKYVESAESALEIYRKFIHDHGVVIEQRDGTDNPVPQDSIDVFEGAKASFAEKQSEVIKIRGEFEAATQELFERLDTLRAQHAPGVPQPQTQNQNAATERPRISTAFKPQELSSQSTMAEWESWKGHFLAFYHHNDFTNAEHSVQLAVLKSCVDKTIKNHLEAHFAARNQAVVVDENITDLTWLGQVRKYFENKYPIFTRQLDFLSAKQLPNESPNEYIQRTKQLYMSGDIANLNPQMLLRLKIITGMIQDHDLRKQLTKKAASDDTFDMDKLEKEATAYESNAKLLSAMQVTPTPHTQAIEAQAPSAYRKQRTANQRSKYAGPTITKFEDLKCRQCTYKIFWKCKYHYGGSADDKAKMQKRYGHLIPKVQSIDQQPPVPQSDQIEALHETFNDNVVLNISTTTTKEALAYKKGEHGKPTCQPEMCPLIFLNVRSAEHENGDYYEILALPDSGASKAVIAEELAQSLNLPVDSSQIVHMQSASKTPIHCVGFTWMIGEYHGNYLKFRAWVCRNVRKDAMYLSWQHMKKFQILPQQYPSPLHLCNPQLITKPKWGRPRPKPIPTIASNNVYNQPNNVNGTPPTSTFITFDDSPQDFIIGSQRDDDVAHHVEANLAAIEDTILRIEMDKMIQEFKDVFDITRVRPIKGPKMKFRFRQDVPVVPSYTTSTRATPYALVPAAIKEIESYVSLGIISKLRASQVISWLSPAMFLPKHSSENGVRLVVDQRGLNKFLVRQVHAFLSPKELIKSIAPNAKYFASFDAFRGYYQGELAEEDKLKTAFLLKDFGIFYFNRCPQGNSASGDHFCKLSDDVVKPVNNLIKLIDDIVVYGATKEELMTNIRHLLTRCNEKSMTLNPLKIKIGTEVPFAGYIISGDGCKIDPNKVAAIREFPIPKNITDVKSFCGVALQFKDSCPNLMGALAPLMALTSNKTTPSETPDKKPIKNSKRKVVWNEMLDKAFIKVKQLLTNASGNVLAHYDPNVPLEIYTDASRDEGLGWVAIQHQQGVKKLIECGSCVITDTARRSYSVSELELLAIVTAMKKLRMYTIGNPNVTVYTDHMPLVTMIKKGLDKMETTRLARMMEKISAFNFKLEHVPGSQNAIADAFSRNPVRDVPNDAFDKHDVHELLFQAMEHVEGTSIKMSDIVQAAEEDENYQQIVQAIRRSVKAQNLPRDHPGRAYKSEWHLLGIHDSLVTLHDKILIPRNLRRIILQQLHLAHLGKQRTIRMAREIYFWHGMSQDITQMIDNCETCQTHANVPPPETQRQTHALFPMDHVSSDLAEYNGKKYLVTADRYTGYLWADHLQKTTSEKVEEKLYQKFTQFGFPFHFKSDNGPPFSSASFEAFTKKYHIQHDFSSPKYPQSNGHAERNVQTFKNILKKSNNRELQLLVAHFNNSPNADGISPSELMFKRIRKLDLPILPLRCLPTSNEKVMSSENKKVIRTSKTKTRFDQHAHDLPPLKVDDDVRIYHHDKQNWSIKGKIIQLADTGRSYIIRTHNGSVLARNRKHIKIDKIYKNGKFFGGA